ncbi:HNH endonuclease [Bacillus sp. FJAT-44742]|uniref:HNH endonuclease n=1 Tax=Bacillus sp. FJAT-44742 TaxID=2014005 RepID=UPI0012FF203B|nr:HNH endonuclease signature motif containing protein [Bacillus sp. FJAT-44742]
MIRKSEVFIKGKRYRRRDIHQLYKGQEQGGISTPSQYPFIFIFTGHSGKDYGYKDGWDEDQMVYYYTGEGQRGDMAFTKGNKAIRDHVLRNKTLYLFKYVKQGIVEFVDEMICIGHEIVTGKDFDQKDRQAIVFHLERVHSITENEERVEEFPTNAASLETLRDIAKHHASVESDKRERKVVVRKRAAAIKLYALQRAAGFCEACGKEAPFVNKEGTPFLEVHHINRLSDGGPDHPEFVAAICPNCHRRAHYSQDAEEFNHNLENHIKEKELQFSQ